MESKKYNNLVIKTKKKQSHREQTNAYQWRGQGPYRVRKCKAPTIEGETGSRTYCTKPGIKPSFNELSYSFVLISLDLICSISENCILAVSYQYRDLKLFLQEQITFH